MYSSLFFLFQASSVGNKCKTVPDKEDDDVMIIEEDVKEVVGMVGS